ncbi:hypothetical protein OROMI_029816 [Orobanche minor]
MCIQCSGSICTVSLLEKGVLTLTLGLKDDLVDLAQVALERGFPAVVSPLATRRLPFPSSEIAINIYGCNMDQNVWDSPEEWKPERFLSVSGKNDTMELHKTMAFGGGKRACAGALQAMTISCIAISRLVQEFEWRLKDGEEANVDTLGLTTHKLASSFANQYKATP